MSTKPVVLNDQQITQLGRTSCNQAMSVIVWDTMIRNGGTVNTDLIKKEVKRRLVDPFNDFLMTGYTSNRMAECYTGISFMLGHWVESVSHGVWAFTERGTVDMENYFNSYPRNFGFESADAFLDLLDLATDPFVPKQVKESLSQLEDEPESTGDSMLDIILMQIDRAEDHIQRLKKIIRDHYPDHKI